MTDSKKPPVEQATAGPGERRSTVRPSLPKASASGDPRIHWLLGERNTAEMNGDADRAAWATAQLAELGFE